ncbi:MAG: sugar phosphate isomerase/epimerase [Planctomycetaceae bacterium]|nr:sugar phosphate isomerase/epimerase [Planctomycetaceae bacterium]
MNFGSTINRREWLRNATLLGGLSVVGVLSCTVPVNAKDKKRAADGATKLGWTIGPHIYSFNRFPFEEAIKKVKETGATHFELFPGQRLSKEKGVGIGPGLKGDDFKIFSDLLAESGCKPHALGVCNADRAHFEFAAKVGFSVLNSEPRFDKIAEVNKLAEEFKIKVGLHNHPKASIYWDPNIVLEHLKDCGEFVGACCDTGHWQRSGLDPLECVKKLKGKVISFHIKDLIKEKGNKDTPLGTGDCKIAEILKEIAEQKVHCPFSIEYEADWNNNVGQVTESVKFFRETADKLAAK